VSDSFKTNYSRCVAYENIILVAMQEFVLHCRCNLSSLIIIIPLLDIFQGCEDWPVMKEDPSSASSVEEQLIFFKCSSLIVQLEH
jgi:hypothetical protein